jgi:hypothetical protein
MGDPQFLNSPAQIPFVYLNGCSAIGSFYWLVLLVFLSYAKNKKNNQPK